MKFLAVLASTAFFLPSLASAGNAQMKYDNVYANGGTSLTSVACSDGQNGLITRYGYQTLSNLPGFGNGEVYPAAVDSVAGWNSPAVDRVIVCIGVATLSKSLR
ncbi:hypothetical protein D9758_011221 [Tetrapyrgos nigripes]|uniref:Uncharacterized protein n=1 Tax=Tetrapyrgos nigripes TaxID=182062 RepID=A0A8H5D8A9_9AGAR|nr:hypothetical protein D9758_011221 [Tetrapyrgos nigripes]